MSPEVILVGCSGDRLSSCQFLVVQTALSGQTDMEQERMWMGAMEKKAIHFPDRRVPTKASQ